MYFSLLENSKEESKLIKEHLYNDLNMLAKVKVTRNHLELNRGPEYTDLEQFLICGKFIIFFKN